MRYIARNNENNGYAYNIIFSGGRKFFQRGEALHLVVGLVTRWLGMQ